MTRRYARFRDLQASVVVQKDKMCGKISVINLFLIAANLVSTFMVSVFLHITSSPKKHTVVPYAKADVVRLKMKRIQFRLQHTLLNQRREILQ